MADKIKKVRSDASMSSTPAELLQRIAKSHQGVLDWDAVLGEVQTQALRIIGDVEMQAHEKRVVFFEQAVKHIIEHFRQQLTTSDKIQIRMQAGRCYETFGVLDKARAAYEEAFGLAQGDQWRRARIEALRWLGNILQLEGKWQKAADAYSESLKLAKEINDAIAEAYAYNGMATNDFEQTDFDAAADRFDLSRNLAEKNGETELIASVYNNLGALLNIKGKKSEALASYAKAASLFEQIGDVRGLAETCHNEAMTYADVQRWADAGLAYGKSDDYAKEVGDARLQAMIKLNRVELYLAINDLAFAEALCRQALRAFETLNEHLGQADVYKFLGVINSVRQKWEDAKSAFRRSVELAQSWRNPLCEAETRFEFGKMWKEKGNKASAKKQFSIALRLFGKIGAEDEIALVKACIEALG